MTGRAFRFLKAVCALIVLIAVIVGVPLLLAALHLVPHSLPLRFPRPVSIPWN